MGYGECLNVVSVTHAYRSNAMACKRFVITDEQSNGAEIPALKDNMPAAEVNNELLEFRHSWSAEELVYSSQLA